MARAQPSTAAEQRNSMHTQQSSTIALSPVKSSQSIHDMLLLFPKLSNATLLLARELRSSGSMTSRLHSAWRNIAQRS